MSEATDAIVKTLKGMKDQECTRSPYWLIVDAAPFFTSGETEEYENEDGDMVEAEVARPTIHEIAARTTGPFFSRKDAEECLASRGHHYTEHAKVYCMPGNHSEKYDDLCIELGKI